MAVEVTLRAFRELPPTVKLETRLARAAQQANIEIHDLALIVPELRGMATTLTAIAIADGHLVAAHVGDSRLYLIRKGKAVQLTKDHRTGQATLTRSVGRELIAAIDRLSRPLEQDDVLVLCTDGVHGSVSDEALARLAADADPARACRALIDAAMAGNSTDNVTVAVVRVVGTTPERPRPLGMSERLRRLVKRT
jgi:serine/threonine protein phosphatase PrpC